MLAKRAALAVPERGSSCMIPVEKAILYTIEKSSSCLDSASCVELTAERHQPCFQALLNIATIPTQSQPHKYQPTTQSTSSQSGSTSAIASLHYVSSGHPRRPSVRELEILSLAHPSLGPDQQPNGRRGWIPHRCVFRQLGDLWPQT
jgi:hypothetical protein